MDVAQMHAAASEECKNNYSTDGKGLLYVAQKLLKEQRKNLR